MFLPTANDCLLIADCRTHHSRGHGYHHEEVGDGEIDNEEVAWGAEAFGGGENVYHHAVTDDGYYAENTNDEAEDCVPQRVYRYELIPVRVDQVEHLRRHFVHYGLVSESPMRRPCVGCMARPGRDRHCRLCARISLY